MSLTVSGDGGRRVGAMTVVTFEAPEVGDRSYLVAEGDAAVVVDPQRDPAGYLAAAALLGTTVRAVCETHVHNDYVSGGLALARATGARYVLPAFEPVEFERECIELGDGAEVTVGPLVVTAIATPGHTAHHNAYLVTGSAPGSAVVCSGGSLLAGATGRTDLFGEAQAAPLGRAQWRSVRRLLNGLAGTTEVLPTHGFGSFCAATPLAGEAGAVATIAGEAVRNPAARLGEDEFVASTLAERMPVPAYYASMAPRNRAGAAAPRFERAPELDADALADAAGSDRWVVDLRPRRAFAAGHLAGTVNLELSTTLVTYLGWLVPEAADLVLVGDSVDDTDAARRLLAAIGREDVGAVAAFATGGSTPASYRVASFAELAEEWPAARGRLGVLDVRHRHEWHAGHLDGAVHVPVTELLDRLDEVPETRTVWVHCAAGYRAAAASSILSGLGARPVLIDDNWANALLAGLPLASGRRPVRRAS